MGDEVKRKRDTGDAVGAGRSKQRRRGHNEGSIYQRESDGLWVASLTIGYAGGKRRRRYLYGATRAEVAGKLKQAQREQDQGMPVAPARLTVGQFLRTWLAEAVEPRLAPRTHEVYERNVRLYLEPALGQKKLARLTRQDVEAMLRGLEARGLAGKTVRGARATLRAALNEAMRRELVGRNVAQLTAAPKADAVERPFLTPEQAATLLAAAEGTRLEAFCSVALALGLRRGEALGLRWEDVDLDGRELRVRRQLQRIKGKLVFRDLKSKRSRRTLPLPETTVAALKAHRKRQLQERLHAGDRWREHGLVFASMVGTPFEPNNVSNHFKALAKRAGLPAEFRLHDLRHSCASFLIAQKVDARMVMEILGHADIGTTMNLYGHVFPAAKREVADLMDDLLGGRKGA